MTHTTTRNFVIALILFILMLGGLSVGVIFLHKQEAALQEQLVAIQKEREQEDAMFRLRRTEDESQLDRARLAEHILTEGSQSIEVLTLIEGYAPAVGVILVTNSLEQVADKETKIEWLEIDVTVSGTEERVERFIEILESIPYVSHLTSVSLRGGESDGWEADATLRILLLP